MDKSLRPPMHFWVGLIWLGKYFVIKTVIIWFRMYFQVYIEEMMIEHLIIFFKFKSNQSFKN